MLIRVLIFIKNNNDELIFTLIINLISNFKDYNMIFSQLKKISLKYLKQNRTKILN